MDINYVAVIVAAVVNMVIGAVWYSPILFAKPWMKATGKKMDDAVNPGTGYALASVASIIIAMVMAHFIGRLAIESFLDGAMFGLTAWLGFVATTHGVNYIFEGRSLNLFNINVGYSLVSFFLMGGLIAAMS
ncbi:MAG TPA: DUF1761 domain-containing protein [Candidatus Saccharimonadia bacterium]